MSYARFGWGGSNVYVFLDVGGYLRCCACWLTQFTDPDPRFTTTAAMVDHLREHVVAGHMVPDETIADLLADAEENDAWIADEDRT